MARGGRGRSPPFGQRTQSLKVSAQLCHQSGGHLPPQTGGMRSMGGGAGEVTPVPAFPSELQLCRARGGLAWRLLTRGCGCGCGQGAPQMGPPTQMQAGPRPRPPRGATCLCPAGPAGVSDLHLQPPPPWRLQPQAGRSAPNSPSCPRAPGQGSACRWRGDPSFSLLLRPLSCLPNSPRTFPELLRPWELPRGRHLWTSSEDPGPEAWAAGGAREGGDGRGSPEPIGQPQP